MPDRTVRITAQGGSKCLVDGSSLLSDGRRSDCRPDQRMAEAEGVAFDDEQTKTRGLDRHRGVCFRRHHDETGVGRGRRYGRGGQTFR